MSDKSLSRKTLEVIAEKRTTINKLEEENKRLQKQLKELQASYDELEQECIKYQKQILKMGMQPQNSNMTQISPYEVNLF